MQRMAADDQIAYEPQSKSRRTGRRRMLLCLITCSLIVGALLTAGQGARADKKVRSDPDDSQGTLDIAAIEHRHDSRALLVHTVSMYEPWDTTVLEDGETQIRLFFYVRGRLTRAMFVDVTPDGSLFGEVRNWGNAKVVGFAKVWRPDDTSIRIEFPRRLIQPHVARYGWSVGTSFHERGHPDCDQSGSLVIVCSDQAPDLGRVRHELEK